MGRRFTQARTVGACVARTVLRGPEPGGLIIGPRKLAFASWILASFY